MKEKRKAERLEEYNEITVSVISEEENLPKEKIHYSNSQDISVYGTQIRGNIRLPVDTLLKIDFKLKNLQQKITALGKVKWIKIIIKDKYYEAGIEFVDTPSEAIQKIEDYISWKQRTASLDKFVMRFRISAKINESESK
ncbi:MAG: PilZ domain-containing protein [Smithella sp.]